METFKELLPEISDKTAIELAALLPRQLFKYIESGLRAYGWIVEEVQKAFETVRIDASEEEQALLDALLNDTVLMFDERKVFPEDWQPFEPKQADEQGEMTDEEYKEYLDKFQKEQDAALIDFTKRLEELSTEKLYTINPDAIAYIKDRAFHIVLSKFWSLIAAQDSILCAQCGVIFKSPYASTLTWGIKMGMSKQDESSVLLSISDIIEYWDEVKPELINFVDKMDKSIILRLILPKMKRLSPMLLRLIGSIDNLLDKLA